MKFYNKRGVSPLIATVLLIAFSVALGAVVMTWGKNIEFSDLDDKCSQVKFELKPVNNNGVCYKTDGSLRYINFLLENSGKQDISGLTINVVGEKKVMIFDIDSVTIKKDTLFEKKDQELTYDFNQYGKIIKVQFTPKIKLENSIDICLKESIEEQNIGIC